MMIFRSFIKLSNVRYASKVFNMNKDNAPVITIPKYIELNLAKWQKKAQKKRREYEALIQHKGNLSVPVIRCKNKKLNFYLNQLYSTKLEIPLASGKWKKGGKNNGDYFTIEKHGKNPGLPLNIKIDKYPLESILIKGLKAMGINHPTPIQDLALQRMNNLNNVLLAAETGTGKTLAYLIPIFDALIKHKKFDSSKFKGLNRPKALILTPGLELAKQIGKVAHNLGEHCDLNIKVIHGGPSSKDFLYEPEFDCDIDVIISTVGIMKSLVDLKIYKLNKLKFVCLDEVDSLLDDSFVIYIRKLLSKVHLKQSRLFEANDNNKDGVNLIMTGATLPVDVSTTLDMVMDVEDISFVATESLHRVMPHVTQTFMRVSAFDKCSMILGIIRKDLEAKRTVMCFTNAVYTCIWLSKYLEENGIKNCELHGKLKADKREENFENFQQGAFDVIVCTDLGSRGLDTIRVDHIINFDMPKHASDYLHRIGRVGRVGGKENVSATSLVNKPYEVEIVQNIEKSVRTYSPLEDVNANIKKFYKDLESDTED